MGTEVVATALAVGSTAGSIQQSRQAAKASKRASRAQQRIQDIKAARERRRQVQQAQQAQAQIASNAQVGGTTKSSSVVGARDSVQSQLAGNLSFLDQVGDLNRQTSIFNQKAADFRSNAAALQQLSSLSLQGASLFQSAPTPTKS